jgi:hypothetical protein
MMRGYKLVLYYLWIAPHVLLAVVAGVMYFRRLHKRSPIFFAYTLYEILAFLVLFTSYEIGHGLGLFYRYVFITTLVGSTALRFGVLLEIFKNVFHGYPRLEVVAASAMRWVTALLTLAAVLSVVYYSGTAVDNVMVGVKLLDRGVTIMQAGLLLFLFLFSQLFGLSWRSYIFGVALGIAVYSTAQIINWTVGLVTVTEYAKELLDLLPTGSYHVAVLIWLGYLLTAEKPVAAAVYSVPEIERWSGELERSR